MSQGSAMSTNPSSTPAVGAFVSDEMVAIANKQRVQDFFFHRITQAFSLLVLVALLGIILSLFVNAWPTFERFGFHFLWHVEWDIINEDFGAAIAIVAFLVSLGWRPLRGHTPL